MEDAPYETVGERVECYLDPVHPETPWRCDVYLVRRDGREFHSSTYYSVEDETGWRWGKYPWVKKMPL